MPPCVTVDTMNYMRIMQEDLFFSLAVFATRKGSPFMHHVNDMLGKARDAGLFFYWEALTVRNYLSTRRQLAVTQSRIQSDEGPIKLALHHSQVGTTLFINYFSNQSTCHRHFSNQSTCHRHFSNQSTCHRQFSYQTDVTPNVARIF